MPKNLPWLVTAPQKTDDAERFAYLGYSHVWFGRRYDAEYNAQKTFLITDRPVYRTLQSVQFKFCVRHTKYEQPETSDFAGKPFTVRIHNPKGEKVFEQAY